MKIPNISEKESSEKESLMKDLMFLEHKIFSHEHIFCGFHRFFIMFCLHKKVFYVLIFTTPDESFSQKN